MFKLRTSIRTETAHLLHDHKGLCRNLHGHSYKWTVTVGSVELNDMDMVMDFTDLKNTVKSVILPYDHAVVLDYETDHDACPVPGGLLYGMRKIVLADRPTAEVMARNAFHEIQRLLPLGVVMLEVICQETENNEAIYSEE